MKNFYFGDWMILCVPECGGNLLDVSWRGKRFLRGTEDIRQWEERPTNYGFPTLFPPNRIADGRFVFNGREYTLPQNDIPWPPNHIHGIALRKAWSLTETSGNAIEMSYVYGPDAPEYAGCPWDCTLKLRYEFSDNRMVQIFTVINNGTEPIPCAMGFHTAFLMPELLDISAGEEMYDIPLPKYLPSGRMLPWSEAFDPRKPFEPGKVEKYGFFSATDEPYAKLMYDGFSVLYRPDPAFAWWMLWHPKNDFSFICIEPMNIVVNALCDAPESVPVVLPGEEKVFRSELQIFDC